MSNSELHYQSKLLVELTHRAKTNIVMYWFVWLSITLPFGIHETDTTFFVINTFALTVITTTRLLHLYSIKTEKSDEVPSTLTWFKINIILTALHWGILTAWILVTPDMSQIHELIMLVTAAFALGGANIFGICKHLNILYPLIILSPGTIALYFENTTQSLVLVLIITATLIHIAITTRERQLEYRKNIENKALLERYNKTLETLSWTDPLTHLKNRLFFDAVYEKQWTHHYKEQKPLSVLMIDIDYFKKINDTYGHLFGDKFIQIIANTIQQSIDINNNSVTRYGGEEFIVLLPHTSKVDAILAANKILTRIRNTSIKHNNKHSDIATSCTVSIGLSTTTPLDRHNKELFLQHIDDALYYAKNNGRDQYKFLEFVHG